MGLQVGVIIGRFQVAEPHEGHHRLFQHVADRSDQVVFLLGVSPVDGFTAENPLTFNQRQHIITRAFTPEVGDGPVMAILPLPDQRTNGDWSNQIDWLLKSAYPGDTLTLYGGRDSFVDSYRGQIAVEHVVLAPTSAVAGRANRAAIKESNTPDFYRGQIFALNRQFPKVYPTIDVALCRHPGEHAPHGAAEVLLIQRTDSGEWSFPGGFVDPTDESYAHAARRELMEETGLHSERPFECIGSFRINDFRYRGSRDKIITTFFLAWHWSGFPAPNYAEVQDYKWVEPLKGETGVSATHKPLMAALMSRLVLLKEITEGRNV